MRNGIAGACLLLLAACSQQVDDAASQQRQAEWRQPLFEGLGEIHLPVSTGSELAQQYFDQGLSLAYAFNHAAADFAFNEAALYDPDCAMCYWGSALVLGPNVNAGMNPESAPRAHALASRAQKLAASEGTALERALTEALLMRYAPVEPEDRAALDQAYADAMRAIAADYPDNVHVQALTAEALMDLHPWDFWLADGEERPWTGEIIDILEHALATDPNHAGAIHLYIHVVEQSQSAHRAEPYADKLADIAPAAGHLVHMPAHIYMRVGRYYDATLNNMRAVDADAAFVSVCRSNSPIYLAGYIPHNWHFGWVSAAIAGWRAQAYAMADGTASGLTPELLRAPGMGVAQHFLMQPLFARVRFGDWQAVLDAPAPAEDLVYATGVWHYARARALIGTGALDEAAAEQAALQALMMRPGISELAFFIETGKGRTLLDIATRVLEGEMQAALGDLEAAETALRAAVALEDGLPYSEPPDWYYPARHSLGVVQLARGDAVAAERTYRDDLARMPENGWALIGLRQALQAQGRTAEAEDVRQRFEQAWRHADVAITASTL